MPIDYKDYPPNWKSEIRPQVLVRAQHRCEICGIRDRIGVYRNEKGERIEINSKTRSKAQENRLKTYRIILTIAHTCQDKRCDNLEHLRALCQQCHLNMDRPYKLGRRTKKNKEKTTRTAKELIHCTVCWGGGKIEIDDLGNEENCTWCNGTGLVTTNL